MHRVFCVCLVLALPHAGVLFAQIRSVPPLQRVIEGPLAMHAPTHRCGSEAALVVWQMGKTAGILTGAERLPGRCEPDEAIPTEAVQFQGMTVEQALNKIVELDPRFEWRERNGVIVIRPVEAWTATGNPLNLPITGFATRDRNYRGPLDLFRATVFGEPASRVPDHEDRSELLRRKFSVTTRTGPAIDALDDIIRAHGALNWLVSYKSTPASVDALYLTMFSFDGEGTLVQGRTGGQRQ